MRNLIIYVNKHYEEEKALYDLETNEILLKGDYYHNKIDYLIKGYLLALNIDEDEVLDEWMDRTHKLFDYLDFYDEDFEIDDE